MDFLSIPSTFESTVTVTIAHVEPDCFDQTFQFKPQYTEQMRFCVKGVELAEDGGSRSQDFIDLATDITAITTTACSGEDGGAPGDVYFSTVAERDHAWQHSCTGQTNAGRWGSSSFKLEGTYTFMGDEPPMVTGFPTVAKHYRDVSIIISTEPNAPLSRQQWGSHSADLWFSPNDGSLLRLRRWIEIDYPWGNGVHYHEALDMTLATPPSAADAGIH
jgi:hypothetical protein